jgi:hypothetical protein
LNFNSFVPKAPFPSRLALQPKPSKEEEKKNMIDLFKKVEVNIPLLDAVKKIPKVGKFLRKWCSRKGKPEVCENIYGILKKLPNECFDHGIYTLPCILGDIEIEHAMLDLGSSINVISHALACELNLSHIKKKGNLIQLADRSLIRPLRLCENVLVKIDELIFPADFFIIDMHENGSPNATSIILGCPFMKTAKVKMNIGEGIISVEFRGRRSCFHSDILGHLNSSLACLNISHKIQVSRHKVSRSKAINVLERKNLDLE